MPEQIQTTRRRALRPEVLEARAGRQAIAPLSEKLTLWHEVTARLAARLTRAQLRGGRVDDILPDIDALTQTVRNEFHEWRSGLEVDDKTGRVEDGLKAGRMVLQSLAKLRAAAYRAMQ